MTPAGKHDFRLRKQLDGYRRVDPEPTRVQPVPLALLHIVFQAATVSPDAFRSCIADMCIVAFFFLCRPGEYTKPSSLDTLSAPFRLCDVEFQVGAARLSAATTSLATLQNATAVILTFTNQKNTVRGEKIIHGRSGDPQLCPVLSTLRRVDHLRVAQAPHDTPLYTSFNQGHVTRAVYPHHITAALRLAAASLAGAPLGLDPARISARSLRPGGAMALLCAKIDTDVIKLVGRWRSDVMLRYLHVQAFPLMGHLAHAMRTQGSFTMSPASFVPHQALPILQVHAPDVLHA